jgi:hypothetical protein
MVEDLITLTDEKVPPHLTRCSSPDRGAARRPGRSPTVWTRSELHGRHRPARSHRQKEANEQTSSDHRLASRAALDGLPPATGGPDVSHHHCDPPLRRGLFEVDPGWVLALGRRGGSRLPR